MTVFRSVMLLSIVFGGLNAGSKALWAFEETDVSTGKKTDVVVPEKQNNSLPEPVYLDDATSEASDASDDVVASSGESVSSEMSKSAFYTPKKIGGSLGLNLSRYAFDLRLGFYYPWVQFLSWSFFGSYFNQRFRDEEAFRYGPEAGLMAHVMIKNIVEPFTVVGVGHESWRAKNNEGTIDQNSGFLGFFNIGVRMHMTKNFALTASRKSSYYTHSTPYDLESGRKMENPNHATEIGFLARF